MTEAIRQAMVNEVVHDPEFRKELLKRLYPEIVEMLEVEGWIGR